MFVLTGSNLSFKGPRLRAPFERPNRSTYRSHPGTRLELASEERDVAP